MSKLGRVVEAVEKYNEFVLGEVKRARTDKAFGQELLERWNGVKASTPIGTAPTGLKLPRLALPEFDEPGEIARYLFGEGLPGEFPFTNGAYREMYLEPLRKQEEGNFGKRLVMEGTVRMAPRARLGKTVRRNRKRRKSRRGSFPVSVWPKIRTSVSTT